MKKYSIYVIRNLVNDLVYVGQTTNVKQRFSIHMKPSTANCKGQYKLYKAVKEYGRGKFYVETLETGLTKDEANRKEMYYIEKFNSYQNGYNSTPGAEGRYIFKDVDIERLTELYRKKVPISDIAEQFKVSEATIIRTADRIGLGRRNRVTEEYLLKNKDFKTNIEMAIELNVDPETISRGFKKYGIIRGKGCNNKRNLQNQPGYKRKTETE